MKSIVTKAMCHSGERSLQRCRGILFSLSISSKWMLLRIRISGRPHTTIDNSLLLETCVLIRKISPRTLIYKKKKHDEYPVIYTQPHWTSGVARNEGYKTFSFTSFVRAVPCLRSITMPIETYMYQVERNICLAE